jgi:hypothetical protein
MVRCDELAMRRNMYGIALALGVSAALSHSRAWPLVGETPTEHRACHGDCQASELVLDDEDMIWSALSRARPTLNS